MDPGFRRDGSEGVCQFSVSVWFLPSLYTLNPSYGLDDKALAQTIAGPRSTMRRGLGRSGFIFPARFGPAQRPRKCL
jgi:hypothetical protein